MSIPAVKGVEIGMGFQAARVTGAEVHDEIEMAPGASRAGNVRRKTNRAGGLEGGMTTGEPLVVRVAMKPISTLMRPLGHGRRRDRRGRGRGRRAQRRDRRARHGGHRGGDACVRARRRVPREVRRRFARRNETEL